MQVIVWGKWVVLSGFRAFKSHVSAHFDADWTLAIGTQMQTEGEALSVEPLGVRAVDQSLDQRHRLVDALKAPRCCCELLQQPHCSWQDGLMLRGAQGIGAIRDGHHQLLWKPKLRCPYTTLSCGSVCQVIKHGTNVPALGAAPDRSCM